MYSRQARLRRKTTPAVFAMSKSLLRCKEKNQDAFRQMWSSNFQSEFDPYVPPVPWRDELYEAGKKWKIGESILDLISSLHLHLSDRLCRAHIRSLFDGKIRGRFTRQPLYTGYYKDDGWFTPTPGCARMVEEAKKALEAKGELIFDLEASTIVL